MSCKSKLPYYFAELYLFGVHCRNIPNLKTMLKYTLSYYIVVTEVAGNRSRAWEIFKRRQQIRIEFCVNQKRPSALGLGGKPFWALDFSRLAMTYFNTKGLPPHRLCSLFLLLLWELEVSIKPAAKTYFQQKCNLTDL